MSIYPFYSRRSLHWLLILPVIVSLKINAGTELLMAVQDSVPQKNDDKPAIHSTFAIQQGKIRLEPDSTKQNTNQTMIYDSGNDSMTIIDHSEKTYIVIDSKSLEQIQAQLAMVKQQMEAQLANLPPEQREMVKKMMQGKMPIGMSEQTPPVKTLQKTGKMAKVAGYDCEMVEVLTTGVKTREMCVTAWSDLKAAPEVSNTMLAMMGFFNKMIQSLNETLPISREMPFAELEKLGGFPVKMNAFAGDKISETSQLVSIKEKAFSEDTFNVPKGYKKRELMPSQ